MPIPAAPTTKNVVPKHSNDTPTDADASPEDDAAQEAEPSEQPAATHRPPRFSRPRIALLVGLTLVLGFAGLLGVLGIRLHHAQQTAELRARYLQVGREGAVNLTTIDWHHADSDVQRILSVSTGAFYDDFSKRAQPFVDVVKKVQSVSEGTVTVAGVESATAFEAQLLVAVSVHTTTIDSPQPSSRAWRMRISVQKKGDDVKVSNVEFVP